VNFCSQYLKQAFPVKFAEYQKEIIEIIQSRSVTEKNLTVLKKYINKEYHKYLRTTERLDGILDIEPRLHGKTTRMCQGFPLYKILNDKGIYVVIVSSSSQQANLVMESIKMELEDNIDLVIEYGEQKSKKWTAKHCELNNGNAISSMGINSSVRGLKSINYLRPSLILIDDIMKDENINSRFQRDKYYSKIKRVIMNLGKDSLIFIVNTIMHDDDIPSRFLKEIEAGNLKNWIGLHFECYQPSGLPLWEGMWSLDDLDKKKKEIGSHAFSQEWLNKSLPEEDRKFKPENFKYFRLIDIDFTKSIKVMSIDPSTGLSGGDFSGMAVTTKFNNSYYCLYADGKKLSDMQLIDWIIEQYLIWKPSIILFESNVFQNIYKNMIVREAMLRGVMLPIEGITHFTNNNKTRVLKLSPLIESGVLLLQKEQHLLYNELVDFPMGYDDISTALEMCVSRHGDINKADFKYESLEKRSKW